MGPATRTGMTSPSVHSNIRSHCPYHGVLATLTMYNQGIPDSCFAGSFDGLKTGNQEEPAGDDECCHRFDHECNHLQVCY